MTDVATTLRSFMARATDQAIDVIAKDGLRVLRRVLQESGFMESEYLKDHELLAHVVGRSILFEILIPIEAVEPDGKAASQDLMDEAMERVIPEIARTYGLVPDPVRITGDARRPAKDARRPAKDARTPARDARRKTLVTV